ncbi:MAG: 4-(cytidine 5'-diphospho)-2-C-methyl-D-erythritol kinase [Candidatus Omnitrophica bacterium]|nr:4-(cytidine 5'-diphospho)-2-C-methyl-D-erythritol kinase [Candidatus Omnitrophota bacterium]
MKAFTIPSYAKLNLSLTILGRRSDGFHELETLFERIDLHDDLTFASAPNGVIKISCDDKRVPCDGRNLVYKVAAMLMDGEKIKKGVSISIKKRIPVAAGLAGGSSNAATALLGLNKLWDLGLSRQKLVAYAAKIGSDVAFFLYDAPFALGTGRGEIVKPLDIKARLWHFLVVPKAPVLTKDVYGCYAAMNAGLTKRGGDDTIIRSLKQNDPVAVGKVLSNDLAAPILKLKPHLGKLKARVGRQNILGVAFSGSGPSVYAVVASEKEALRIKKVFSRTYSQVFAVRTF